MSRLNTPAAVLRPATLSIAGLAIAVVAVVGISMNPARAAADPGVPQAASPSAPAVAAAPDPTPVPVVTPKPAVSAPAPQAPASDDPGTDTPGSDTPGTDTPGTDTPGTDTPGTDAMPIAVELDTFDGHQVSLDIVDRTGSIVSAVSGQPGDNPSADGLAVVNVDDHTLRLTWVDFPIDNRLALFVDDAGDHLRFLLIQPAPTGVTDAIGFDRQVILTFDRPVDASTVEGIIQEGMDTPG